ncbi:unnamed protein product, partial [Brassica rapa subsp. trilocularis]
VYYQKESTARASIAQEASAQRKTPPQILSIRYSSVRSFYSRT